MKTEEKIGLGSFFGLAFIALPFLFLPPPTPPQQIALLPGQLVMGIPEDDSPCADPPTLIWGAVVLKKFATQIGAASLPRAALPENLRAVILEQKPPRLYLFGHGNATLYTCEKCQWFLTSAGLNLDLMTARYVHLVSCLTAQDLGHKIIDSGATAYFGYYNDFWLIGMVKPSAGRYCEAALYGDMQIEVLLIGGETDLKTIYSGAVNRINDEIAYWQEHWAEESCNGTPVTEADAQQLINVLIHNRDALRCYHPGGQYP